MANGYSVRQHRLLQGGRPVDWKPGLRTAGVDIAPRYVVIHYTVMDFDSTVRSFCATGGGAASAHLVIGRDGRLVQMVAFNHRAWHAGRSQWGSLNDLNSHSIGIELENVGWVRRAGSGYVDSNGKPVPAAEVVEARHPNPNMRERFWQTYTAVQLATCEAVCRALADAYPLDDILGHEDIAPDRKFDPGPAFALAQLRESVLGL